MLISFVRTVMLLVAVIAAVRLMGKRQIGQLQPSELVITILLSQIAATPMQDNDLPMLNTVVAILVLAGTEILLSVIGLKSIKAREFLEGKPVIIINDGVLDREQLKRLRYTADDVAEALRQKDIFDISQVEYADAETNGAISVLLKPDFRAVSTGDLKIKAPDNGMPFAVISDGKIIEEGLKLSGMKHKTLQKRLSEKALKSEEVFYMTIDKNGNSVIINRGNDK